MTVDTRGADTRALITKLAQRTQQVIDASPATIAAICDSAPSAYGSHTQFATEPPGRHADQQHMTRCQICRGLGNIRHPGYPGHFTKCPACGGNGETPTPIDGDPGQSTTVESVALSARWTRARHQADKYTDTLADILTRLGKLLAIGNEYQPANLPARCNRGVGRDNVTDWGDPQCERVAESDRGGMCARCAKAEYRDRVARGLPPRDRDAA